jgi:hypothetical protein
MSRIPIRIPSKSKYRAVRTDGYASKKEARRAVELELLLKMGTILSLQKQREFILVPADELGRAVVYRADFYYHDVESGTEICEDVKGVRTPLYKLKRRLMWRRHGIKITEI